MTDLDTVDFSLHDERGGPYASVGQSCLWYLRHEQSVASH